MEAVLSYSFGQLLYEMAMCRPLNASIMENTPHDMAAALSKTFTMMCSAVSLVHPPEPVVESLLSKDAVKKPLPTIYELIENE